MTQLEHGMIPIGTLKKKKESPLHSIHIYYI